MCLKEGAAEVLHYDKVVEDISAYVSLQPMQLFCVDSTYEKTTRFGSRFLEKGKRSGSCFEVQSSMVHYCIQKSPEGSGTARMRCFSDREHGS